MVQINFGQREVSCKVVFYGPGMSGKTTNLEIIHKKAPKDAVGEMVSIATETDRTLYFDFLPLDLGQVAGMRTKFQLYTVPGQIYYNATRKLVLQGVDGVIFVADSNPDKMAENLESFQNLKDNFAEMGLTLDDVPVVLQYNKRDLPNAMSVEAMNAQLNPSGSTIFEACARDGKGVFATLKEVSRLVIEKLNKEHAPAANRRRTANNLAPAQPTPIHGSPISGASSGTPVAAPAAIPAAAPAPTPPMAVPAARPVAPPPPARPVGTGSSGRAAVLPPPPPRPPAPRPQVPQPPAPATQPQGDDPRTRHLSKPKPPALASRPQAQAPDVAQPDPSIRAYQDQRHGGNGMALKVIAGVFVLLVVFLLLLLFVRPIRDALRPMFPTGIQRLLMDEAPAPTAGTTANGQ